MSKKVLVIIGSVRTERAGSKVADWLMEQTPEEKGDVNFELVDLAEVNLPFMDEPAPPMSGLEPQHEHTRAWARKIQDADGFVLVTPEYNHGLSPVLKNAIDYLYKEWKDKPVLFVGYGAGGASFSIEQLRQVAEFVGLKPISGQIGVNKIWEAFDENGRLRSESITGHPQALIAELISELRKSRKAAA